MQDFDLYLDQLEKIIRDRRSKPITDLEVLVLKYCYQKKTYAQMSIIMSYAKGTLADIGMDLFKIFSSHFNYEVKKANFVYFCQHYLGVSKLN